MWTQSRNCQMIIQASSGIIHNFVFVLVCACVKFVLEFIAKVRHLLIRVKCKCAFRYCLSRILFSVLSKIYHFVKVTQMFFLLDSKNVLHHGRTHLAQPAINMNLPFLDFDSILSYEFINVIVV